MVEYRGPGSSRDKFSEVHRAFPLNVNLLARSELMQVQEFVMNGVSHQDDIVLAGANLVAMVTVSPHRS